MRASGFTLIELLVVVVLLAIVAATAVPGYRSIVASNRVSSGRDDLLAAFQFAKSEAITGNKAVTICSSQDGASCLSSPDWGKGWMVFRDQNLTGAPALDTVLRVHSAPSGVDVKEVVGNGGTASAYIRFKPTGIAQGLGNPLIFSFCDPQKAADPSTLKVGVTTGQVKTGATSDATCN